MVLPLVPVTPTTVMWCDGSPSSAAAASAIARRASATTTWGTCRSSGRSTISADGAVRDRLGGEVVAVGAQAAQSAEQGARLRVLCAMHH